MRIGTITSATCTYGASVLLGVYLASGNGSAVTAVFVGLSVFCTFMARRDRRPAAHRESAERVLSEPARPIPSRTYEVTVDTGDRLPFHLSDADLFSRAS